MTSRPFNGYSCDASFSLIHRAKDLRLDIMITVTIISSEYTKKVFVRQAPAFIITLRRVDLCKNCRTPDKRKASIKNNMGNFQGLQPSGVDVDLPLFCLYPPFSLETLRLSLGRKRRTSAEASTSAPLYKNTDGVPYLSDKAPAMVGDGIWNSAALPISNAMVAPPAPGGVASMAAACARMLTE